jgi:signal transduction histidine kinase
LAEVLASGQPIAYRETALRGVGGEAIQVAGGYSRTPMTSDGPVRATAILRDVSAVRALEQLREGFVATVSHELRTPLALVRGYAESILHLDLAPGQEREYVDRIHQVTSRLGDLVDQILDVTHLDADPLILERAPVAFASLVARCRGDLALSGDDSRLVADLPDDLPPIDVDSARIGRVLENLVGNALKYAPPGSPVTIGASVADGWLWATVDDEGVGVPEEERGLVLEPFHRAWNVRESRIPGTGLGLYICRRLIEAHGGRLTLGERPNGEPGTRVSFSVPILAGVRRPGGGGRRPRTGGPPDG